MRKTLILTLLAVVTLWAIVPNDPKLMNLEKAPILCGGDANYFRIGLPQWGLLNQGGDTVPLYEMVDGVMTQVTNNVHESFKIGADISATRAWNIRTDCRQVIIAIIDSGVSLTPDIIPNLWLNTSEVFGRKNIDDDNDGLVDDLYGIAVSGDGRVSVKLTDWLDRDGHGTAIAGVIGSSGNNGIGTTGVCWTAQMMCLKSEMTDSSIVRCINYAISHGAKVINCSWGTRNNSPVLKEAFSMLQEAGIICVLSSGNMNYAEDERDIDKLPRYPASWGFDNCVVVASTDMQDNLYSHSYYGLKSVHLAALGRLISTTGGYDTGTSFAAPFVTGAVALIWNEHPDWSYRQVIDCLLRNVDILPNLQGKCISGGRLNLFRALADGREVIPPTLELKDMDDGITEVSVVLSPFDGATYMLEGSVNSVDWISIDFISTTEKLAFMYRVGTEDANFFRLRAL